MSGDAGPRILKEFFCDYSAGDKITTPGRTVTEADIVQFASFSSDWNAVHTDKQYAERHTPFGQRIAHGLLGLVTGLSMLFRQWSVYPPSSWVVLSGLDRVRFDTPIYIGDTIHLEAEVMETTPMTDSRGIVEFRVRIKNQEDKIAIACRLKLLLERGSVTALSEDRAEGADND